MTEFEDQLHEFAAFVGLVVALEQGQRVDSEDAYKRIKKMWKSLKRVHKGLDDGQNPLSPNG